MSARTFFVLLVMVSFSFMLTGEVNALPPSNDCATGDCKFSISSPNFICDLQTKTEGQIANDSPYDYPYGLVEFDVRFSGCGGSIATGITTKSPQPSTVQICFSKNEPGYPPIDMAGFIYRKYGPTPDNHTPHWYDFMYDGQTGAELTSENCFRLHFIDGEKGDDDLTANGVIVDQGGPGRRNAAVPAITPWGMGIVAVLIGLTALLYLRRTRKAKE